MEVEEEEEVVVAAVVVVVEVTDLAKEEATCRTFKLGRYLIQCAVNCLQ